MKQIEANPWTLLEDKYPIGSVIKGQVRNVTDFGVFVGVEEGIDGLVHVSDISWTQRIKHPGEMFKKGDEVEAVVLNIDVENERFSLGIKQLTPDPWDDALRAPPGGQPREGQGHQGHRLRRVRGDRARHRGPRPRLRAEGGARREPARRRQRRARRST